VPRSVIASVFADKQVKLYPLPARIARAKTQLIWRKGHRSAALDALREEVSKSAKRSER